MNYKCVGLLGWGKSCQSLYNFLINNNIEVHIWDDNPLVRDLLKSQNKNVTPIEKWNLYKIDVLIVSPGIPLFFPLKHPILIFSEKYNIPIYSDIELFYSIYPNLKYIGVTGSNGKSTVVSLLYHVLSSSGFSVELAGNIGIPIFDIDPDAIDILILELSSYQLGLFKNVRINYSIILDITPDHLEHHNNYNNYIEAKGNILNNQLEEDIAILSASSLCLYKNKILAKRVVVVDSLLNKKAKANFSTVYFDNNIIEDNVYNNAIIQFDKIKNLQGLHNKQNISFAYIIAREFDISPEDFTILCSTFKPLDHRQQVIRSIKNVTFINDSKATNIEATEKALINYNNIYWIVGGILKTKDFIIPRHLLSHVTQAFIIGKDKKILINFCEDNKIKYIKCKDLKTSLKQAYNLATLQNKKAVVLLSPAAASFDEFKNFEDRGEQFVKMVKELN